MNRQDPQIEELKYGLSIFIVFLLIMAVMGIHEFRYDLHLTKPKFKTGDCGRQVDVNEFNKDYFDYNIILNVGKHQYQTLWYGEKSSTAFSDPSVRDIEIFDKDHEKVECPKKITILK